MYNKISFINETGYAELVGLCGICPNYVKGQRLCAKLCERIIA